MVFKELLVRIVSTGGAIAFVAMALGCLFLAMEPEADAFGILLLVICATVCVVVAALLSMLALRRPRPSEREIWY